MQDYEYNDLKRAGFRPESLTETQRYLVLLPNYGPENYMCDGEITPREAMSSWKLRMRDAGLTASQINKAIKFNFG